jgi:hypothetical protein
MQSKLPLCSQVFSKVLLAGLVLSVAVCASAQDPAQNATPTSTASATTRSCTANPVLAPSGKQKQASKTKHPLPLQPAPACIEVKGEPLEVQEALQAVARDLQWRIHENHATEDSWTFVRYLNTEELEKYADTKVLIQPVDFEDGKSAIVVRTVDIGGGFVRVQISAQFEGDGKSTDTTMKQPATTWPLNSRGVLEKEMIAALESRYHPMN